MEWHTDHKELTETENGYGTGEEQGVPFICNLIIFLFNIIIKVVSYQIGSSGSIFSIRFDLNNLFNMVL